MAVKRTRKNVTEPQGIVYKWKKLGGGTLYMDKKIIKPNDVFEARESDIPKSFLDCLVKLSPVEEQEAPVQTKAEKPITKKAEKKEAKEPNYKVEKTEKGFDIVDKQGKTVNELPLEKEEADELLDAIE